MFLKCTKQGDETRVMTAYISYDECVASERHLISVDEDGFCNFCGEQDGAEYEEDKKFETLAKWEDEQDGMG